MCVFFIYPLFISYFPFPTSFRSFTNSFLIINSLYLAFHSWNTSCSWEMVLGKGPGEWTRATQSLNFSPFAKRHTLQSVFILEELRCPVPSKAMQTDSPLHPWQTALASLAEEATWQITLAFLLSTILELGQQRKAGVDQSTQIVDQKANGNSTSNGATEIACKH